MKRPNTPKQRRVGAAISGVFGIVLIGIGILYLIPQVNLYYGLLWVMAAILITVINFYHAFSKNDKNPEFSRDGRSDMPLKMMEPAPAPAASAVQSIPTLSPPAPSTGTGTDQERQQQLAQLDRLLESGVLTREEYRERKDKLNFRQ